MGLASGARVRQRGFMSDSVRATIRHVSAFHPETVVTNQDLEKRVDTSDEWIRTRTGITERRVVQPGQGASDLAVPAIQDLLAATQTSPESIDLIVVGTVTPDTVFPSTACRIQHAIQAKNAWGFDLSAACSGFLFALGVGEQFIRTQTHRKVLVVGVDVMSAIVNPEDRNTCVLFGDGAGAALLEPTGAASGFGILDWVHHIDGEGAEFLHMPAGGSRRPATERTVQDKEHFVHQEGSQVYKAAVLEMANACEEVLARNKLTGEDVDLLVAHQANLRIIESCRKRLRLPKEKVVLTIDRYANTTAATIPTCLAEAAGDGRLGKGKLALVTAFGAGFTWGAMLVRWSG